MQFRRCRIRARLQRAPSSRRPCASGCFAESARCIPFCWSPPSCRFWFSSCWPPNVASGKQRSNYFPDEDRDRVQAALDEVSSMLRSFVAGNALIALILMLLSWAIFPVDSSGVSLFAGLRFGSVESGAVPRRGAGLGSALSDRHRPVEHGWPLSGGRGRPVRFFILSG